MGGKWLGSGAVFTIFLAFAVSAAALPVPVSVLVDEDTFDTDSVGAGAWLVQSMGGGHYAVADSELRLYTDPPAGGVNLVQVGKVAVLGPLGAVLETTVRPSRHGIYELAMWVPLGGVNLAATAGTFRLYSTNYNGFIIDSEFVPLSWPVGTTLTFRLTLFLDGSARADVFDANGGLVGSADVAPLWAPIGLEVTIGVQAWTAPGIPAADYFTDVVKLSPVLP